MEKVTEHSVQWKTVKLGDCCSSELGKTLDEGRNTGKYRPYLCALNVLWGKIDTTIIKQMRIEDEELNRYLVKKGDLLVCEGGEIGRCAIWDSDDEIYYQNALHRVRFYDDYDSTFFMYLLCYYNDLNLIEKFGKGLTIKHLNQASFRSIPVSVPDLPVQRRIAAILSVADKVIEQTRQLINKYKSIKQGMMEDLLKPKEGWKMVRLGEVAQTFTGLTYSPSNINNSGTLVLRSSNIKDGRLCFEDNVFVSMDIPERAMVHEDDILICVRNGSRNLIGKCALITKDAVGMAFGAFMTVLRATTIDPRFLLYIWQSNGIQRQVANNIGATINQITNADFNRFEISVPDLSEQRRIAKILSGIDRKIEAEEKVLEKYKKMKKGLMERMLMFQTITNNKNI